MKKVIILIALLFGFATTYAQTFNPVVNSGNVTMTTKVINPFWVKVTQTDGTKFADVIKGQNRTTFSVDQKTLAIFSMGKEADETVRFHIAFQSTNVGGVKLSAHWEYRDTPPAELYTGWAINTNDFDWSGSQTLGWIGVILDGLDATTATATGTKTFTCTITGSYTSI